MLGYQCYHRPVPEAFRSFMLCLCYITMPSASDQLYLIGARYVNFLSEFRASSKDFQSFLNIVLNFTVDIAQSELSLSDS